SAGATLPPPRPVWRPGSLARADSPLSGPVQRPRPPALSRSQLTYHARFPTDRPSTPPKPPLLHFRHTSCQSHTIRPRDPGGQRVEIRPRSAVTRSHTIRPGDRSKSDHRARSRGPTQSSHATGRNPTTERGHTKPRDRTTGTRD